MERKQDGLLIYDERADWWSLGVSLYEITTGGFHSESRLMPFLLAKDEETMKGRFEFRSAGRLDLIAVDVMFTWMVIFDQ